MADPARESIGIPSRQTMIVMTDSIMNAAPREICAIWMEISAPLH